MDKRTCSAPEGCDRTDILALDLCGKHYQRWRKHGDTSVVRVGRKPRGPETCSECDGPAKARGYCPSHYMRWWAYGDPNFVPPPPDRATCSECNRPAAALGYCTKHYRRFKVHGDPSVVAKTSIDKRWRKYSVDHGYFDQIDTPDKAYWLGFITADGCVTRTAKGSSLDLTLAEVDAGHLSKYAVALGSDAPMAVATQGCVRIRIHSQRLVAGLVALGVGERKSLVVEPPLEKLSGLDAYYWRGLFDGDGHVSSRRDRDAGWTIHICGSLACVEGFASWARQISGATAKSSNKTSKNPAFWKWAVRGTRKAQLLAEQLRLAGPGFGLDRKQAALEAICAFDLDEYEARLAVRQAAAMREAWATGRHPRARRTA